MIENYSRITPSDTRELAIYVCVCVCVCVCVVHFKEGKLSIKYTKEACNPK